MIDAPLAYAFTAGAVATVNPCGFAMLPAYLSYFLGIEAAKGTEDDRRASVGTALIVGAAVSAGFLVVFGIVGTLVNAGVSSFIDYVKWATIAIGIGLVVLGIAMLRGYHLPFSTPRLDKGGRNRTLGSIFLFGVSYAIASISCTLPIFLVVVFGTLSRTNFASGVATFVAYGMGMAMVLVSLTIALALAKQSFVHSLRHAMRYVDRVAGALLIVAGRLPRLLLGLQHRDGLLELDGVGPDHVRRGSLGSHRRQHPELGRGQGRRRARRRHRRVGLVRVRPSSRLGSPVAGVRRAARPRGRRGDRRAAFDVRLHGVPRRLARRGHRCRRDRGRGEGRRIAVRGGAATRLPVAHPVDRGAARSTPKRCASSSITSRSS